MKQEKGNWAAVSAKRIISNVDKVFRERNIGLLSKQAYRFIIDKMGFIAHYDLHGFRGTYADLREFCARLQASEYSNDPEYNARQADRQEADAAFNTWYGAAYCRSTAEAMRGLVAVACKHEATIARVFSNAERESEIATARALFAKHGVTV